MSGHDLSRRRFLEGTAAGTVWGLGSVARGSQEAGAAASGKRKVGVVGIGGRGGGHVRLLQGFAESAEVVAVCDLLSDRAEKGKAMTGGRATAYTDYARMLRHGGLDTVVIATPNYVHKEQAVASLDGGFYTFVEKPMATTIADCNAMIEAVGRNRPNRSKGICQVGLQFRHHPLYQRVHTLVSDKAIGEIKYVWCENFRGDWRHLFEDPEEDRRRNWRYSQRLSGGSITEKNCHDLDIFGWIIGVHPVRVGGTGGVNVYAGRETNDHYTITVDYDNGCKLTLGTCLYAPSRHDTVVIGSKGTLEFPRSGRHIVLRRRGKKDERIEAAPETKAGTTHGGTFEMFEHFFACIGQGKMPFCNPAVGKECIRVALAGETAIREQRSVRLRELPA